MAKEVPDRAGCQRVARAITAYLAEHPEHYVGIHCSYGFNRTGLVCCACTYARGLRDVHSGAQNPTQGEPIQ